MKKVSVILPVYNVENYLSKCIESLSNQTYQNVEYLFIDDGSMDNSGAIITEKSANDSRFRYYKKENGGVSSARNLGIEKKTGDFIMFYDPDDYLYPDAIENLIEPMLKDSDINVTVSRYRRTYEGKRPLSDYLYQFQRKCNTSSTGDTVFENKSLLYNMYQAPWGKMFRASIFDNPNIRFPENTFYEDLIFTTKYFPEFGKVLFVDKITVDYLVRPGSAMTTNNDKNIMLMLGLEQNTTKQSLLEVMNKEIIKSYKERNIYNEFQAELEFMYIQHIIFGLSYRIKASNLQNKQDAYSIVQSEVIKQFPDANKNIHLQKESFILKKYCALFMNQSKIMNFIFKNKK